MQGHLGHRARQHLQQRHRRRLRAPRDGRQRHLQRRAVRRTLRLRSHVPGRLLCRRRLRLSRRVRGRAVRGTAAMRRCDKPGRFTLGLRRLRDDLAARGAIPRHLLVHRPRVRVGTLSPAAPGQCAARCTRPRVVRVAAGAARGLAKHDPRRMAVGVHPPRDLRADDVRCVGARPTRMLQRRGAALGAAGRARLSTLETVRHRPRPWDAPCRATRYVLSRAIMYVATG